MNRLLKCCICAVFLMLVIPFAAFASSDVSAAEGDLEAVALQLDSADSIDSQLALINDAAETFSDVFADGGWDVSLSPALAGELPDGLLPEDYDDAQYVEDLPEELKEGRILAFYDDEGSISLLGDFMARLSSDRRASSLEDADIMLVVQHMDVARTDYIGSAYNRDYFGYMWRTDSGDVYQIFSQVNTPPFSGMGTLYGSSMSKQELWDRMRFDFFTSKAVTEADGTTTTYTLMADGWYLSSLEGDRQVLEVPGEIDGYPVASISCPMTYECPSLQRIVLNEGIKNIEDGVFEDLDSLLEIILPESLVRIGANAFAGCDSLAELRIPDGVESIGANAFSDMRSLAGLQLPATLVELGSGVITGFNRIGSLALPEGLTQFPENCFTGSYGLTALYVPSSVVNFPEFIPEWIVVYTPQGSPAQMWAEKQGLSVTACDSADAMPQISVGLEDQFYYVINGDEAILVNTDPDVQYINVPEAFEGKPLTTVRYAFYDDDTVVYINVPEGVTAIGDYFCYNCDSLEQVVLPSTLKKIGNEAFQYCTGLKELVLPDGLESLGRTFASSCSSLASVTLPAALTEIPEDFMQYDTDLASLVIPEGVRRLSVGMLIGSENLFSLYLPSSVVQVDATLPSQVTIFAPEGSPALMWAESNGYESRALEDPSQMPVAERFEEGDLVYYLYDGEALLSGYIGEAEELVIPETLGGAPVTRILSYAIPSDSLVSITVADSVRRIDYRAFHDNDYLEELYLPGTIEYMDDGAINGIYHDCTIYTPEGSYAWDFVSRDLNCAGGHVFTLENWDHESVSAGPADTSGETEVPGTSGFFPDLDSLMAEPLLTYGSFAGVDPDERTMLGDGSIYESYFNVTKDDYSNYGNALGSEGYVILDTRTEGGSVSIMIAKGDIQFLMTYEPDSEIMFLVLPPDENLE